MDIDDDDDDDVEHSTPRQLIRRLRCPVYRPTSYRDPGKANSTKIDPDQVTKGLVPSCFVVAKPSDDILAPVHYAFVAFVDDGDTFPRDLFGPSGSIAQSQDYALWEASAAAPSGEAGVSHFLKTALFDQTNMVLRRLYPPTGDETRIWCVIGIGPTGKSDWGLFVNGRLVVIVEIKPHSVSAASRISLLVVSWTSTHPLHI